MQLLSIVGDHLALGFRAEAVALDGLGQDDGRSTLKVGRGLERRIDLLGIMSAAAQLLQLFVAEVVDHLLEFGGVEEVFADVGSIGGDVVLVLAVDDLAHAFDELAIGILGEDRIPVVAPDRLDTVPASAAESPFEFLDDLAIAAYGSVEALEVAVHHPHEVVELLAARQSDCAEGFRLVDLAIADEAVDPRLAGIKDAAMLQISQEAGVVDRADRPEAHRHGRELPEVLHQPRMRIGAEALAPDAFLTEVFELRLIEPTFEERPRVHSGGGVPLEVNHVAGVVGGAPVEEVIVGDFIQCGRRGIGRDVAADAAFHGSVFVGVPSGLLVRPQDHRHRVPADVALDLPLDLHVPRIARLVFGANRVDIRSSRHKGDHHSLVIRPLLQIHQQLLHLLRAEAMDDIIERLEPLLQLARIDPQDSPINGRFYVVNRHVQESPLSVAFCSAKVRSLAERKAT